MNIKSIFVLLASGLYVFTCHYWYCCNVKAACYGCAAEASSLATALPMKSKKAKAILFGWDKESPIVNASFGEEKKKWLAGKSEDNLLEITGTYFKDEKPPSGFKNMGLARADAVRKLLLLEIPDERIRLKGARKAKRTQVQSKAYSSVKVSWIPSGVIASTVINFGKKAIILYPQNSYFKETNVAIDNYLKAIAKRVKKSKEIIFLTGHTDNEGDLRSNERMGLRRAKRVRRILRQKGVSRDQIVTSSKGEQEPIASNATEKGRYQNRRVVLEIKPASQ